MLGQHSSWKTVQPTAKDGTLHRVCHIWCSLIIVQGHTADSQCSWSTSTTSLDTDSSTPNPCGWAQDHSAGSHFWRPAPMTSYRPCLWGFWGILAVCFTVSPFELWSDLHHWNLWKKIITHSGGTLINFLQIVSRKVIFREECWALFWVENLALSKKIILKSEATADKALCFGDQRSWFWNAVAL